MTKISRIAALFGVFFLVVFLAGFTDELLKAALAHTGFSSNLTTVAGMLIAAAVGTWTSWAAMKSNEKA